MKFLAVFLILMSYSSFAATCKKLTECVDLSSQLTGQKIIYDKKIISPTFELNQPLEMNKENVSKTLSEALNVFGLAKIPTQLPNTVKLIEAREIRFHSDLPNYDASKKVAPKIPDTQDPVMLTYKGVKGVDMEVIAENVKPLLSRYGRVQAMRDGTLVVMDLATHVNKVFPLIQKQDFPLTTEEKNEMALTKKRAHDLEMARLKSGERHEIGPHKSHEDH